MEFFGLTQYGISDPIKFLMKPGYKEPENLPDMVDIVQRGLYTRPLAEVLRDVDIYSGVLDGYAYRSVHRKNVTKFRGFYKPIGPSDMYREPATETMKYGWFLTDPALEGQNWFKNDENYPQPSSEDTKFRNIVLVKDKQFSF